MSWHLPSPQPMLRRRFTDHPRQTVAFVSGTARCSIAWLIVHHSLWRGRVSPYVPLLRQRNIALQRIADALVETQLTQLRNALHSIEKNLKNKCVLWLILKLIPKKTDFVSLHVLVTQKFETPLKLTYASLLRPGREVLLRMKRVWDNSLNVLEFRSCRVDLLDRPWRRSIIASLVHLDTVFGVVD